MHARPARCGKPPLQSENLPSAAMTLINRDYHPGNTMRSRRRLAAIADRAQACSCRAPGVRRPLPGRRRRISPLARGEPRRVLPQLRAKPGAWLPHASPLRLPALHEQPSALDQGLYQVLLTRPGQPGSVGQHSRGRQALPHRSRARILTGPDTLARHDGAHAVRFLARLAI